jgi:ABC-type transport system involved in multi-copper enzyme maturation permease subunit
MTVTANGATSHPLTGLFAYPQNWEVLAWMGRWINLFLLGFLGVYTITMEFTNRTLRQSVIFGMTRIEVAASKLVWSVAVALAATGFYILLAFGAGALDGGGLRLPIAGCVLGFFLQALGYLFLGTLAGLLIRQTGLAAVAYLAYVLFLEAVCRWVIYFAVAKTRLLLFLPNHVLGALTPLPGADTVRHIVQSNAFMTPLSPLEAELAALVYIALFAILFCRRIVKSDL